MAIACSKEESNNITPPSQVNLNKNPESVDEVTSQVISFLDEIDNNNVDDRNKEDALFILEAALNYNYRRPMNEYSTYKEGETTDLQLTIDNDIVDGTSLKSEYERILTLTETKLDQDDEVVELIDISNAADTNGVEQLKAVIVIGVAQPRSSYLNVGDWAALADLGDCNPKTTYRGDAAFEVAKGHNYLYRNNFYHSAALQTEHRTFFSGIKVSGDGYGSGRYPDVNPDLKIDEKLADPNGNPTLLSSFSL